MDLAAEAERLRLDVLAVRLSGALVRAGVPHALLKGPTTARWLYDPPRRYRDVDLLVPMSQVSTAAAAFASAGLTTSRSGGVGEEAHHSLLLHSREGFEVDLHITLPAAPVAGDRLWELLKTHREPFAMDVGSVPALDATGRCLVLALHAIGATVTSQPAEDLRRARTVCGAEVWSSVEDLAHQLGIRDLVDAGIAHVEGLTIPLSRRARLYVTNVPEAALGLQRLADSRRRDLPRLMWRELLPSRGFMVHANADADLRGARLGIAHVRRWRHLARQLPAAIKSRRQSR